MRATRREHKQRRKEGQQRGGSKRCRALVRSKWYLPGFSLHPGSTVLVEGNYSVEVVQTQVVHSGEAGEEGWLNAWSSISATLANVCAGAILITLLVMRHRWKDNDEHIVNLRGGNWGNEAKFVQL